MGGEYIAIDFDGSVVTHEYPLVGVELPNCVKVLKALVDKGHDLILFTMRGDKQLDDAVKWFEERGITLYGIQTNPTQKHWTDSPKAYAGLYIDDAALGAPLCDDFVEGARKPMRPHLDWYKIEELLIAKRFL